MVNNVLFIALVMLLPAQAFGALDQDQKSLEISNDPRFCYSKPSTESVSPRFRPDGSARYSVVATRGRGVRGLA